MSALLSRRDSRKNHLMRSIVNFGQVLARGSLGNAAQYLKDHGVPWSVAARLLIKKGERNA